MALVAALGALPAGAAPRGPELSPGRVIVRLRAPNPARLALVPARIERAIDERTHLLRAASEEAADRLVAELARDPEVELVERDHVRRRSAMITANDPLFQRQWSLSLARLPAAWSRTIGSDKVVVAVLDSGIQPHPDLQPRYLGGYDFITADDNAADNQPGRDPDPTDTGTQDQSSSQLHGMHVTGIVGAHTDNAVGMAGVDWACKLLPVRVLGTQGGAGQDSDIADAIRWAAGLHVDGVPDNANPAQVINMSFGAPGGSGLLQSAINDVDALGVIVVSAAGNDGGDTSMYAPAGLNHVIAVGAADATGNITYYSNRGSRLDLLAPGGDLSSDTGIVSTMFDETDGFTYVALNGTSQASPHVAGVAALMKSIDPLIGGTRARMILSSTADPAHQCQDGCGGGLLDADAAVAAVQAGCADGHCSPTPNGFDLQGGCAIGGHAGAPGLGFIAGLLALGLALRRRAV